MGIEKGWKQVTTLLILLMIFSGSGRKKVHRCRVRPADYQRQAPELDGGSGAGDLVSDRKAEQRLRNKLY